MVDPTSLYAVSPTIDRVADAPTVTQERRAHTPTPATATGRGALPYEVRPPVDRKSTRLNSSHSQISYAVFCLKKKNLSCPMPQLRCCLHTPQCCSATDAHCAYARSPLV